MGSVQDYGKGCKQGNARANKAQAANDVLTADLRVAGSVVASLHDEVASKGTDHHRTPPLPPLKACLTECWCMSFPHDPQVRRGHLNKHAAVHEVSKRFELELVNADARAVRFMFCGTRARSRGHCVTHCTTARRLFYHAVSCSPSSSGLPGEPSRRSPEAVHRCEGVPII